VIVRRLSECIGTDREVHAPNWSSRRLLLARDGARFSLHDTVLAAGTATRMCYRHHVEAVYCIGGRGRVEDLATGEVHDIEPGTLYYLDRHDEHVLIAEDELRMVCVFDPALSGRETHDESGAYPPAPEGIAPGAPAG
jgi:L-ectoine synthase